jgi:hypothetical protein
VILVTGARAGWCDMEHALERPDAAERSSNATRRDT